MAGEEKGKAPQVSVVLKQSAHCFHHCQTAAGHAGERVEARQAVALLHAFLRLPSP